MISLDRRWTVALAAVLAAGALLSAYLAWHFRFWVGLGALACDLEPAWRPRVAWAGIVLAAALQLGALGSVARALVGRGDGRRALQLLVCLAALTVLWAIVQWAFGGWTGSCFSAFPN